MKKRHIFIFAIILIVTNILTAVGIVGYILNGKGTFARLAKQEALEKFIKEKYLYDADDEDLYVGSLKGIVKGLNDPYSEYYTGEEFEKLMEMTTGVFFGVGVEVTPGSDGMITVVAPIKGGPSEKAGIMPGDKIIKVDGVEYTADEMTEAVSKIRGEKGTKVTLTIYRPDATENSTFDIDVVRDEVHTHTVITDNLEDFAYIGITNFDEGTSKDFREAVSEFEKQNVKGYILDLRGNPGGIVDGAVDVVNTFIGEGNIVSANMKDGTSLFNYDAKKELLMTDKPLTVLVNGSSASASEIVSGALKDHNRATLIGTKTFGKGIVQQTFPFGDGDGVKITTAEYFTPSGENIHRKGIMPDVEVELPKETEGIGMEYYDQDLQLQKAVEILKDKTK